MREGISRIGIIFIIYLFISILTFFVLSNPIDQIFGSFEDSNFGDADNEKDSLMNSIDIVMKIFWALFIALPVTWIVSKVFSREPASYYRKRRK